MTNKILFVVEHECADEYYGYNLEGIFSTIEKAQAYIAAHKPYEQQLFRITTHALDELSDWPDLVHPDVTANSSFNKEK